MMIKSHTMKAECPKCKSDNCNATYEDLGELIRVSITKVTVHCNSCTYTKVGLLINRKELVTETKEPEFDETEIEYTYLGWDRG